MQLDTLLMIAAAIGVVIFVYLRFGKQAATLSGALLALVIAYAKGRSSAKQDAEHDQLKEENRNAERREDQVQRADEAADRARVDNLDPDRLREHDPFERR